MTRAPNNPKDGVTVLHPGTAKARRARMRVKPPREILDMTLENLEVGELPLTQRQQIGGGHGPST